MIEAVHSAKFTSEEVDRGMAALLMCGNAESAHKKLRQEGLEISARSLRRWRATYPERFQRLARKYATISRRENAKWIDREIRNRYRSTPLFKRGSPLAKNRG